LIRALKHDDQAQPRTAQKYSKAVGRERLRAAAAVQWPAPTTTNDLTACEFASRRSPAPTSLVNGSTAGTYGIPLAIIAPSANGLEDS